MRVRSVLVFSVVAFLFAASVAQAITLIPGTFNWSVSGAGYSNGNFTIAPGASTTASIYLQNVGGNALTTSGGTGLFGMGATVAWSGGSASISQVDYNSVFTNALVDIDGVDDPLQILPGDNTANISDYATAGKKGTLVTAGTYQILLGTYVIEAGAGTATQFTIGPYALSMGGGTVAADTNVTPLDSLIPNLSFTVNSVPEPSTLVLSAIAALGFFGLRLRRKTA